MTGGLPVGPDVPGWQTRPTPERRRLEGRYVDLVPTSSAHFADLYAATCGPELGERWTYLPDQMPAGLPAFWMLVASRLETDPATWTIVPKDGSPAGMFSLLAIDEGHGRAEIGFVVFGPALARTRAATEAVHLLQSYVLDELGYRRLEWKCDSLNEPSRRAASRFGFTFEGTFRNHWVVKGRSRDTDWFSITDAEWPALRAAHEVWLDPANFDADGQQLAPLERSSDA